MVGLIHNYLLKKDFAALMETLGTGVIGAALSAFIVGPMIGSTMTLDAFIIAFSASSIPGSILGFTALLAVRRSGLIS